MLLASDYDHTLYRNGKIAEEDLAAGNLFGMCTGRAALDAYAQADRFGLKMDFLIASNGAALLDGNRNFLFRQFLPDEAVAQICRLHREAGCVRLYLNAADGAVLRCFLDGTHKSDLSYEEMLTARSLLQCNAHFSDAEQACRAAAVICSNVDGITAHLNHQVVDCSAAGLDKGTGVAMAAKTFSLTHAECFVIGDNQNDLPMLTRFQGACMADGDPETLRTVGRSATSIAAYIESLM